MTESRTRPISILRKVLVWAFVVGFWFFFYWYRGLEQSNKKSAPDPTPPAQAEPLATKKQP